LNVEPVSLEVLVKEFLDYLEANRSEKYTRLWRLADSLQREGSSH